MNTELVYRDLRFQISPARGGARMWAVYPEERVVITGTVEQEGLEDILRKAIVQAQEAIDQWLDAEVARRAPIGASQRRRDADAKVGWFRRWNAGRERPDACTLGAGRTLNPTSSVDLTTGGSPGHELGSAIEGSAGERLEVTA